MRFVWKKIKRFPSELAMFFIRCYQMVISPHFPGVCRFEPTCSQYSLMAFDKYGFFKGLTLSVKRVGRCRPGGPHGYDPLP